MTNTLLERTVIANKCVLYKQSRSKKWWCRIKLENGKWHRVTTGCYDIEDAIDKAIDIHADARVVVKSLWPRFYSISNTDIPIHLGSIHNCMNAA